MSAERDRQSVGMEETSPRCQGIAEAEAITWAETLQALDVFVEHLKAASAELDKLYAPKDIEA